MVRNCLGLTYFDNYIKQLRRTKESEKGIKIKVSSSRY